MTTPDRMHEKFLTSSSKKESAHVGELLLGFHSTSTFGKTFVSARIWRGNARRVALCALHSTRGSAQGWEALWCLTKGKRGTLCYLTVLRRGAYLRLGEYGTVLLCGTHCANSFMFNLQHEVGTISHRCHVKGGSLVVHRNRVF